MIGFVQRHRVREIQHVDFLELAVRSVVGGHYVEREIADVHDPRVALSDPAGFHDQKSAAGGAQNEEGIVHNGRQLGPRAAGCQAPDEHIGVAYRVQADPIPNSAPPVRRFEGSTARTPIWMSDP